MASTPTPPNSVTVLGIDPGSRNLGWGVVNESSGIVRLVACGVIHPKGVEFSHRIGDLFRQLHAVVSQYRPDEAAIENMFTHKNAMSALKLGQARGAAIAACAAFGVPVADYEPTVIKKSLVGTGRAEKEQVGFMVARILGVKATDWSLDTSDALGCAICHLNTRRMMLLTGKGKS